MRPADDSTPGARLRGVPDLRMPLLGLAAWVGGLAAYVVVGRVPGPALAAVGVPGVVLLLLVVRRRRPAHLLTVLAVLLVGSAVACSALVRHEQVAAGPVGDLARERVVVSVEAVVTSDPRPVAGRFGDVVLLRLSVREVLGRGERHRLRAPVLVLADEPWLDVPLGARVAATGRLGPAEDPELAGVLSAAGGPELRGSPDVWWRGAAAVRASLRRSVAHRPADQRVLVPALVNGDDAGMDPALADDFRATGLTHLLAVSGTNLTLVVGFLLVLARWAGSAAGGCTSSAPAASSASCCWPAPSRACCGRR